MALFPLPVDYSNAEKKGMVDSGNRAIEMFRPFHFGIAGYPFSINSIEELWKYTECMHDGFGIEGPIDDYIVSNFLRGGFTAEEFGHIKTIVAAVEDLGKALGKTCQVPTNTLFYALNHARHIRALAPPGSTVVELGGGAGYLGALLVLMGYRYVGSDISQAFYLLQSQLLDRVSKGGCVNLVDDTDAKARLAALQPGQAAQIPWWQWARPEIPRSLAVDVVTSNHNILEMHPFCFLYHVSVLRDALTPNSVGFVFEGWGDPSNNPTWKAVQSLANKGFVMAHNDRRITCFTHDKSPYSREGVMRYAPGGAGDAHYATPEFSDPSNPLSKAIVDMRKKELLQIAHSLDDYKTFLNRKNLATVDERYLAYIFRDTVWARPWTEAAAD
jgi:antitoxin (DNA-binding transcriptional repressor) of toxin-antitoxin stability system